MRNVVFQLHYHVLPWPEDYIDDDVPARAIGRVYVGGHVDSNHNLHAYRELYFVLQDAVVRFCGHDLVWRLRKISFAE